MNKLKELPNMAAFCYDYCDAKTSVITYTSKYSFVGGDIMILCKDLKELVNRGGYDNTFVGLYPLRSTEDCRDRYAGAAGSFLDLFGNRPVTFISAPGRTEVSGNHTDHQRGIVLAASVDLDIICVVSPNNENIVRVKSKGYPMDQIRLNDMSVQPHEAETSAALIRGVAAWFSANGYKIGGFDAYTTSDVPGGSGLSSSAAFEVALGNIFAALYGPGPSPEEIAMAGQYAENKYFGKPSGLMDQMASSVGGFVQIDFENPESPRIEPIAFDLSEAGFHLCIVDTKGSHSNLTADYAAIPDEMRRVSEFFGKRYLRETDQDSFYKNLTYVRSIAGDRAVLRAIHFFNENALVPKAARALKEGRLEDFLSLIIKSGYSSFTCLQNVFSPARPQEQGLSIALTLSEEILAGKGAWRVHGGGFAGTIQAFVPDILLNEYRDRMETVFGAKACRILTIRPKGGIEVIIERI